MKIYRPNIQSHQAQDTNQKLRTKGDDLKYVPEDFKKVARGLEQQFVEYMLENKGGRNVVLHSQWTY